jgi:hypothetical protein
VGKIDPPTSVQAVCKFSPIFVSRTPSQKITVTRSTISVYSTCPWPLWFKATRCFLKND